MTEARISFLSVLNEILASKLSYHFKLIVPVICKDEESIEYVLQHESSFVFFAKEFLLLRVVGPDCSVKVELNWNNRIKTKVYNGVNVITWSSNKVSKITGWNQLVGEMIDRLHSSLSATIMIHVSKKASFEIINKMVGNEPLQELKISIESALNESHISSIEMQKKAVEEFTEKERLVQMNKLEKFIKTNISLDVLTEDDFLQFWREKLISDVMDD